MARALSRLSGQTQLDRLFAIEEKVGAFGRAQREELARQRQQIASLDATLPSLASAETVRHVEERLEQIERQLAHQDRLYSNALERAGLLDEQGAADRRFARRIEEILSRDRTILVGPWTGEVGFELIYWIPFVRWVVATYGLDPARLVVVSRGGTSSWYGSIAHRYVDVFDFFTPDEFRVATEEARKQRRVGSFDAEVVTRIVERERLGRVDLLHPGLMYRLLMPFWKDIAPMARVERYSAAARFERSEHPVLRDLPSDYVAARFYFSECFPDTAENRAFVATTLEAVSRRVPVVLLNTPFHADDHQDAAAPIRGVKEIAADHLTPAQNLATQSAVIAGARGFVGTYGGYSYLAPFCGVTSLAFYSERTFKAHHLHVAQQCFSRLGPATVIPLDVTAAAALRQSWLGAMAAVP